MPATRVLVAHTDPMIGEMIVAILTEAGYHVEVAAEVGDLLAGLKQLQPDERPELLILEVRSAVPASLDLLDQLRTDPDLQALPILTLATMAGDAVLAQASANVFGVLLLPFDIFDLTGAVASILALRRLPPPRPPETLASGILAAANSVLLREQRNIILRWAQRAVVENAFPKDRIQPAERLGRIPTLFSALLATFQQQPRPVDELFAPEGQLYRLLTEHVSNRRRLGMPLANIALSWGILAEECCRALGEGLPDLSGRDMSSLAERVVSGFSQVFSLAIQLHEAQEAAAKGGDGEDDAPSDAAPPPDEGGA